MLSTDRIKIHEDLLRLKPSGALEHVSMSQLARKGTSVLRKIQEKDQAVTVSVQGQDAMVTLLRSQYDEIIGLIQQIHGIQADDGFDQELTRKFDCLIAEMSQPGAADTAAAVLFGDPADLNRNYRPGTTETGK